MNRDIEDLLRQALMAKATGEVPTERPVPRFAAEKPTRQSAVRRAATRWSMPLLAAAAVVAVVGGSIGAGQFMADRSRVAPANSGSSASDTSPSPTATNATPSPTKGSATPSATLTTPSKVQVAATPSGTPSDTSPVATPTPSQTVGLGVPLSDFGFVRSTTNRGNGNWDITVDRVERQPDGSLLNQDPMIYEYHLAPLESPTGLVHMRYVSGTKSTDISPVGLSYLFEHTGWWQTLPPIEDLVATITTDGTYVTDIVFTNTK